MALARGTGLISSRPTRRKIKEVFILAIQRELSAEEVLLNDFHQFVSKRGDATVLPTSCERFKEAESKYRESLDKLIALPGKKNRSLAFDFEAASNEVHAYELDAAYVRGLKDGLFLRKALDEID
jgi:hypothetical protein